MVALPPVSPWLPKRTSHFSVGCSSPFKPGSQLWPVSFYHFNHLSHYFFHLSFFTSSVKIKISVLHVQYICTNLSRLHPRSTYRHVAGITWPHLHWKLVRQTVDYTIRLHLFSFLVALGVLLMYFHCCVLSLAHCKEGKSFLIIFLHHTSPPFRSFPRHQQSHPENQFAQEAGLFHFRRCDWRLHHTPVALHFPLICYFL